MASVEKHGNSYRIRKTVKGKLYILTFDHDPTKSEITIALADAIKDVSVQGTSRTFAACADEFIEANDGALSPNTLKEYRGTLNRLPSWFAESPLRDLDELKVQRVVSEYAKAPSASGKPRSRKTVNNMWHFISVVLRKNGLPPMNINVSGAVSEDDYMPTEDDIKKLLTVIEGTNLEIPVKISAFASLREAELLALDPFEDVKDGMIHVCKSLYYDEIAKEWKIKPYPKNGTSVRYTPIPEGLEELIHAAGCIYPYRPNILRRNFHKACEKAGVPHMRFHRLRAYYSSALHSAQVPDKYIMARGGWKTDAVLKKNYQRALADKQSEMDKTMVSYFEKLTKS